MQRVFSICSLCAMILLAGLCSPGLAQSADPGAPAAESALQPAEGAAPPEKAMQENQQAQETTVEAAQQPDGQTSLLDTSGRSKLSLLGLYGVGFRSIDIGVTTGGDTVSISGGGGYGFAGQYGYGLSSRLDLDIDLGVQVSVLSRPLKNAEGTFARSYVLATLKYKVPTSATGQFKIGLGAGSYVGGELDIDTSDVPGGAHTVVSYKPALGIHATGEFERFINPGLSFHLGGKVYAVTYRADEVKVNGVGGSTAFLAKDVKDFDGSGFDVMIGISKYF